MLDGDDTVDDIAMNSAAADTEATSGKPSILRKSSYEEITNDTKPSSLRKPKFGVHDDSPLKIAMDQFPGSNNNIEEGLVQQQTSTSPPQSSKRASFDDAEGLGSPIPKRDSIEDSRLSSRVSFDDNAPSVKDYVTPKQRDSLDHNRMMKARLSTVSKMYDIDGDGQLDEAELAMRRMDTSGRGYLTNEKVLGLMTEQLAQQRQLFKLKKVIIGLAAVVLLLTLSNLGTSFAAAYLAKDTSVSDKEELVNSKTNEALGTQSVVLHVPVEGGLPEDQVNEDDGIARRMNCIDNECDEDTNGEVDSRGDTTTVYSDSEPGEGGYFIRGDREGCFNIIRQCEGGRAVDIDRTFSNRQRVTINICNSSTRIKGNERKGLYTFIEPGQTKINLQITSTGCKFDGPDLVQRAGEVCDVGSDCQRRHKCYQMTENRIRACKTDCERAFDRGRQLNRCTDSCWGNTCELINKNLVLAGTTPEPSMNPTLVPTTFPPSDRPSVSPSRSPNKPNGWSPTPSPSTGSPTRTARPTVHSPSTEPSGVPTVSSRPTRSPQPTLRPSISTAPTVSSAPSESPTVSTAPTVSSKPTPVVSLIDCPPAFGTVTGQTYATMQRRDDNNEVVVGVFKYDGVDSWQPIGVCVDGRVDYSQLPNFTRKRNVFDV